jgi:hypothetical protein
MRPAEYWPTRSERVAVRPAGKPITFRPRERRCPECGEAYWTWAPNHGPECSERCRRARERRATCPK